MPTEDDLIIRLNIRITKDSDPELFEELLSRKHKARAHRLRNLAYKGLLLDHMNAKPAAPIEHKKPNLPTAPQEQSASGVSGSAVGSLSDVDIEF